MIPCPLCGGMMILRDGEFGSFYGCLNYPQCRGTRSLDEVGDPDAFTEDDECDSIAEREAVQEDEPFF